MGFEFSVTKTASVDPRPDYEMIRTSATYASCLTDALFSKTYDIIKEYTLVDKYRCYELWEFVSQTDALVGDLIEVGVWKGGRGALIAKKVQDSSRKDTVHLCDTFTGVVKAGENDSRYKGGEHADTSRLIAEEVIEKLSLHNIKLLVGIWESVTWV